MTIPVSVVVMCVTYTYNFSENSNFDRHFSITSYTGMSKFDIGYWNGLIFNDI